MKNFFLTLPQYLIPQKLLSNLLGKLANQSFGHQTMIKKFVKHYGVNMSEAKHPNIDHYKTFNDFFIRALNENAREIDTSASAMVSPVDGTISQLGSIT